MVGAEHLPSPRWKRVTTQISPSSLRSSSQSCCLVGQSLHRTHPQHHGWPLLNPPRLPFTTCHPHRFLKHYIPSSRSGRVFPHRSATIPSKRHMTSILKSPDGWDGRCPSVPTLSLKGGRVELEHQTTANSCKGWARQDLCAWIRTQVLRPSKPCLSAGLVSSPPWAASF